jgi:RNA polymerase sigma-70 factor, ECF subfamily
METPRHLASPLLGEAVPSSSAPLTFDDFFETERTRLFGALAVMSGNRAEAEEVMQEAFLKVWERWDRVAAMDSPTGFLYRSAMNVYRSRIRRAAVAVRKAANLLPPDDALGDVDDRDELTRLLQTLTPREREAIVLTSYLGYSTEEAGKLLGIRASTVRVLTTRARASIRRTAKEQS